MENYKGPDALAEWCAREMRLNIDGKELVIKPTIEHYRKIRAIGKETEGKSQFEKLQKAEETREIFKDILRTTFPNSGSVEDFLERYETKFQIALFSEIIGISQEELKKKFFQTVTEK